MIMNTATGHGREGRASGVGTALGFCLLLVATKTEARETWRGDMETGNLAQWSAQLNAEGSSVVDDPVLYGGHAAKITITNANLWSNGLNRVELQRKPAAALTEDGSEVYFGYSIYLPEALTNDDHQLGYWETQKSYVQVMSLHAHGEDLSFNTNQPYQVHWQAQGALTPETWHRIVYRVAWSSEVGGGRVSLWFDGEKVVDGVPARTYLGDPAFIQVGILRDTIEQVETLYLDEAFEGTSFDDVSLLDGPAPPPPVQKRASGSCAVALGSPTDSASLLVAVVLMAGWLRDRRAARSGPASRSGRKPRRPA